MNSSRPHVRTNLPWIQSGPLWKVNVEALADVETFIEANQFVRVDLDGSAMSDRASVHAQFGRGFGFPGWYGNSWDAFNDCMYGFARSHDQQNVAVVWHRLDVAAASVPASVGEAVWALLDVKFGRTPAFETEPPYAMNVEVFATGVGEDFNRPG